MTALHSWKANFVVLDFAPTTGPVFFREATSFHLIHEQVEVIGDKVLVVLAHNSFRNVSRDIGITRDPTASLRWNGAHVTGGPAESHALRSIDHTEATADEMKQKPD